MKTLLINNFRVFGLKNTGKNVCLGSSEGSILAPHKEAIRKDSRFGERKTT